MGLSAMFPKETIQIVGKPDELATPSRVARSSTPQTINYKINLLLQKNTQVANGDLLTFRGSKWYATAHAKTFIGESTQIYKCNATMDVVKLIPKYVGSNKVGDTEQVVLSGVAINQYDVSGNMKSFEPGLIDSTVKKIIVGMVDIKLQYRLKFGGKNYQVTAVNEGKYESLLEVQVSNDTRPTVT